MRPIFTFRSPRETNLMNAAKAFTLCLALVLPQTLAVAQQTRSFVTYTPGIGTASESDRGQALSEATQQAQNAANSTCTGTVTNSTTTASNCTSITNPVDGSVTYTCMVSIRDTCSHP
jgi:hypothetical protein